MPFAAAMRAAANSKGSLVRAGVQQRAFSIPGSGAKREAAAGAAGAAAREKAPSSSRHILPLLAASAAAGATVCVATVAATADSHTGDGRSDGTTSLLRPLKEFPRDSRWGALRLVTGVAHASAIHVRAEEGGEGMSAELPEGEKPELIKQADAEAEKKEEKLRRPQQFSEQFHEVRNLTSVHSFEGFRLDVSKVVTPTFYTSHTIFLPNSQMPNGLYQGVMTVLGDDEKFIRASMDHEFNVGSEAHLPLGMGAMGKLNVQLGKQDMVMGTASYAGETFCGQVNAGVGPVFGVSYNQALTPRLTVGGDGNFNAAQVAAQLQFGFKYNTPGWACMGSLIRGGGGHIVLAQYLRRVVPGRVTLAAEYQAQLFSPRPAETSQACIGAEFVLRQSKVSASVDSSGKVDSTMEVKLLTFMPMLPVTFTLSSSLDHGEGKATFGLALSLGQ